MEVLESLRQSIEMLLQLEPLNLNWALGNNETASRHEIYNETLDDVGRREAMPTLALLNLQLSYAALADVIRVFGVTESGYANFAELAEQS